jgi:ribosomal protein S15P/S13E
METSEIKDLEVVAEKLKKHLAKHKHDYRTKRALTIKKARLKKLEEYRARKEK